MRTGIIVTRRMCSSCRFLQRYFFGFNALIFSLFTLLHAASAVLSTYTQQRHDAPELEWKKYNPQHMLATAEMGKLLIAVIWLGVDISIDLLAAERERRRKPFHAEKDEGKGRRDEPEWAAHMRAEGGSRKEEEGQVPLAAAPAVAVPDTRAAKIHCRKGRPAASNRREGAEHESDSEASNLSMVSSAAAVAAPRTALEASALSRFLHRHTHHFPLRLLLQRFWEQVALLYMHPSPPSSSPSPSPSPSPPEGGDDTTKAHTTRGGGARCEARDGSQEAVPASPAPVETQVHILEEAEETAAAGKGPSLTSSGRELHDCVRDAARASDVQKQRHSRGGRSGEACSSPSSSPLTWCSTASRVLSRVLAHVNAEAFLMAVPAFVYAVQNLFILDAQSKLDPMVYQVFLQSRILLMAVAMRVCMQTVVTPRRWISLCLLLIGVVIGQFGVPRRTSRTKNIRFREGANGQTLHQGRGAAAAAAATAATAAAAVDGGALAMPAPQERRGHVDALRSAALLSANALSSAPASMMPTAAAVAEARVQFFSGLTSLFLGILLSVVAAVYMEAILKRRAHKARLPTRNIHLALFSFAYFGFLAVREYQRMSSRSAFQRQQVLLTTHAAWRLSDDPDVDISTVYYSSIGAYLSNYFHGFDGVVWLMILIKASNAMLTAVIMRYSDNIIKTLATAASIVLSGVWGHFLFDNALTVPFSCSAAVVMAAVLIYNLWK